MSTRKNTTKRPLALAYIRVSTIEQAQHGASMDAQRSTLTVEAERRGWDVEVVADEGSGKNLNRPGLTAALARLDAGEADYLLSVRLDRVSRSVADFAGLLDRSTRKGWGMVLLDPNVDTSAASGRLTANIMASVAQFERELIGIRTREGMAQRKLEGVKMGRPRMLAGNVVDEIRESRQEGTSLLAIARSLNERNIPTAHGGAQWHASTIKAVLARPSA
jgi:DNA invertase Pin-like site-specific DNA recombinase